MLTDSPQVSGPKRLSTHGLARARESVYTVDMAPVGLFFLLILLAIVLARFAFWIWMLVECATKEPDTGNTKIC
jgi:hypothetical protein